MLERPFQSEFFSNILEFLSTLLMLWPINIFYVIRYLQRGFMDPLDKLQALLIIQLLNLVKDDSASTSDKPKKEQ